LNRLPELESAGAALILGRVVESEITVKTVFSTLDVHPRDRFDYWHGVACANIVDHESHPECRQTFEAELQSGVVADIGLVLFKNSPMTVFRSPQHVKKVNSDELFVGRQLAGSLVLEQDCREVILGSGDIALIDPRLPYGAKFSAGSRLLLLKFPRRLLEARIGGTQGMTACSIKPSAAEARLTSAFLAALPACAGELDLTAAEVVQEQVIDLVALSLAKALERSAPRISAAKSIALLKVRAAIESRLTDPDLDANTVAAAAGVSVRYANAVLSNEDTTIMRLVQARRLARCRRALEEPLQAHRTISEIAYAWGFSDMTHFGRRFRAAYGVLPGECRRLARAT
jgi:AraC family transcriptional regulator, positive regulator of tynA and feaB